MFGHTPPSHVHQARRIPSRCPRTLRCDMNPPRWFHIRRPSDLQSGLNARRGLFFFFCLVLSLELHVCNVWQDAANALDQPRGGWEREKLGRHLITGPHQMLELFSHRAWNFVCREMIYNFTLSTGGKQGDGDAENVHLVFIFFPLSLCQQIPEWFPVFDYFSFHDCNNRARCKNWSTEENLVFSVVAGWGPIVHPDAVLAWIYKIIAAHHRQLHAGWFESEICSMCSQSGELSGKFFSVVAQGQREPDFLY